MTTPHACTGFGAAAAAAPLRRIADLPGPRRLPLLGNILHIKQSAIHLNLEAWARRYGPLYRFYMGPTPILVVSDHQLVSAMFRDRPDGFRRTSATETITNELGGFNGLFLAEGAAWRHQRRMVMSGFAPHAIKAYFPALLKTALRLRGRWDAAAASGQAIALGADLKRYTVDLIAGLAFGTDVNTIEDGDDVIQGHLDTIMHGVARRLFTPVPYWRYLKLPSDRRLERSAVALNVAVDGFIAAARIRLAQQPALRQHPGNLLEAMLVAADQADSGVADDAVAGNVKVMLLAGEDTTANTLCWMIYLLQRHPEALQRARAEVLAQAPDVAGFCIEQLDGLDYLDACAQEAMRLKPVGPFNPHQALRDTSVADVAVPAGSQVWALMRHDSVAEAHLAQAAAFMPERWLPGAAPYQAEAKRLSAPFGVGLRTCPGRYLALLEIKIAMAMLLGRYDIVAVDTADGGAARENMGFVMAPDALTLRLRHRGVAPACMEMPQGTVR